MKITSSITPVECVRCNTVLSHSFFSLSLSQSFSFPLLIYQFSLILSPTFTLTPSLSHCYALATRKGYTRRTFIRSRCDNDPRPFNDLPKAYWHGTTVLPYGMSEIIFIHDNILVRFPETLPAIKLLSRPQRLLNPYHNKHTHARAPTPPNTHTRSHTHNMIIILLVFYFFFFLL